VKRQSTTFGDLVADSRGGTSIKTSEYGPAGTPVLTKGDVKPVGRVEHGGKFVDTDYVRKKGWRISKPGDFIVTTRDLTLAANFLGLVSRIPTDASYVINQGATLFRIDESRVDPRYFIYWCCGEEYREHIKNNHVGSTQIHIRQDDLFAAPVRLPSLPDQKAIVSILGALDDKIDLNRRMNGTLEAMARVIFKSWFVDFDPVRAKLDGSPPPGMNADTAAIFPDRFEHVDGELVPKGWVYSSMPEVTTFREGPGILAKDFHEIGIPLIRLAGLKNGVSLLDGCNFLESEKVDQKWSHFRLEKGDVLLSTSASLGRVAEVGDEAVGAIPYTGLIAFRPQLSRTCQRYIRHYLTSSHFQIQVHAMGVGSVLRHFGPTHLKSMTMLVPPLAIQSAFADAVGPLDQKVTRNLHESRTLAAVRDTLLPKLLSGEIRVADAEKVAEGVA
jgi:type I restriction enzyme, S subunit